MTIVFLTRLFYPHIGGVEKHVREVGKRLIGEGHKLIVITESSEEVYPTGEKPVLHETVDGMEVYRIPVGENQKQKKWKIWWWMWQHRILFQNADIVHCHDVFFWYLPFRLLFPGQSSVYTTFHGYESYPIRWQARVDRKISEKLSKGTICIGDFMKKWYGAKPTFISYGGVKIFSQTTIPESESALFWGRLDEQTGILTYEAAVNIISKEFTHFKFTIIGDGNLSKKINHKFSLLSFRENISEYLNKHRFAFVSRYLSILEALAAKRLVFAVYDNPVKKDYLKMAEFAPFIIIEDSAEKLAEKVAFFLKHPKQEKELIEKGFSWVKDQRWERVVAVYEKLWGIS
jgi:glycosyltransferase involved in cell wall biosynthesis